MSLLPSFLIRSLLTALKDPEWSVQRLYLQKSYAAALELAIEVLHAGGVQLELNYPPGAIESRIHAGTLPKNEARDREMLDVAIRCAIKLGDRTVAVDLARATRDRVRFLLIFLVMVNEVTVEPVVVE